MIRFRRTQKRSRCVEDQFRHVGIYAGPVLKGENPGDSPVQQPTKNEFVINATAAKTLGLSQRFWRSPTQ